jgi:hypothetical protein
MANTANNPVKKKRFAAMAKIKATELIKQRASLKEPNGPHILGRLLALERTVVAPARAPLIPMKKKACGRGGPMDPPATSPNLLAQKKPSEILKPGTGASLRLPKMASWFWTPIPD